MCVEKFNPRCTTPTELVDAIPHLRPISKRALKSRSEEGVFDLVPEADDLMDSVNWNELFSIHAHMMEGEGNSAAAGSGAGT